MTPRRILVLDVGGTHVKVRMTGQRSAIKIVSGPKFRPIEMIAQVADVVRHWKYQAVSIGYPGPVVDGRIFSDPQHLGHGWKGYNFDSAFGAPVRIINDAAMQALGGYRGGRMLFLGLGTGLGSALVIEGHLQPLELAHLPYRKHTFEEYVSDHYLQKHGKGPWRTEVRDVIVMLQAAMQCRAVLLGGGNARHFRSHRRLLPPGTRLGGNQDAFQGGLRLWLSPEHRGD